MMSASKRLLVRAVCVIAIAALTSCTRSIPYRTIAIQDAGDCRAVFYKNDQITQGSGAIDKTSGSSDCWLRSLEEHLEYDLLTVEFDDQGWLQGTSGTRQDSQDQIFHLLQTLRNIYNDNQKNGIALVVYVHGWHHNAMPEDHDVIEFRRFLAQIKAAENGRILEAQNTGRRSYPDQQEATSGPRVVGVYVGWRGESTTLPILRYLLTFWERKSAAEQVAAGSVRELFQQLAGVRDCGRTGLDWDDMRQISMDPDDPANKRPVGARNVGLFVIGHSFGGLVAYRGLSSEFIDYAARGSKDHFLPRVADLVVIANPAFEGARYEPLHRAARRVEGLRETQLPAVIIATSEADWATRYAFPIARYFYTLFEPKPDAEWDSAVLTVGHNQRYTTHRLSLCDATDAQCKLSCEASERTKQSSPQALTKDQPRILAEKEVMQELRAKGLPSDTAYLCGALKLQTTQPEIPLHNPYLVVSTTKDIMKDHGDIFNEHFVTFFRQMYVAMRVARQKNPDAPRCSVRRD